MPESSDNVIDDPRGEAETAIADHIVALSLATDTPDEFEPTGRAFSFDDVDFSSPAWMACLAEVQDWLRLPERLELDDPTEFLRALARGLGFPEPAAKIEETEGLPRLTADALDQLSVRLQQATRLQEGFGEALEADGGSRRSATGSWVEAWEDEEQVAEDESSEPVSAKASTWSISDFSSRASRGRLNLSPSYQRGDVWPTSDAQMLIESIVRGIPLPSVIILRPSGADAPFEVVDGKQRLTTILRFIGKHPLALERVREVQKEFPEADFERAFANDYVQFRRLWKNLKGEPLTASRERELYFPFKLRSSDKALRGDLAPLRGRYYTEIRDHRVKVADYQVEVQELFESVTDYKIPLIEYSKATHRQIHEVFNLYNRQGKHLNAEEIRNAVYHELDFMRGLLVASGDNRDVDAVAQFLSPVWDEVEPIGELLTDYGIGSARYRKTKVLSWLASMLLMDSMENGAAKRLSTARHMDALLERIHKQMTDPLRDGDRLRDAFVVLANGMEAHATVEAAWAPNFRDTKDGAKWQELQLVASLLGVTLAAVVLGDDTSDHLESAADSLNARTQTSAWQRPSKTQTASQWEFIARTALRVAIEIGVDLDQVSEELIRRFGFSCVPTLRSVAPDAVPA